MDAVPDYRHILKQTLVSRCDRNPRYSLRAFARDLGLDPARLSDILNRKKGISRGIAESIVNNLGLNSKEAEQFCISVEAQHSRSKAAKEAALLKLKELGKNQIQGANLSLDAFKAVSDWYHFAILQLLKLPEAKSSVDWIASALELKPIQVKQALERMLRLEMLVKNGRKLVPSSEWIFTSDGVPSEAIKKFHEQTLQKAIVALHSQSISERSVVSVTVPMAKKNMAIANQRIRNFLEQLSEELSSSTDCDSVYCLSTQFFNLTPALKGDAKS